MRFLNLLALAASLLTASPALAQSLYNPTNSTPTSGPTLAYPRVGYPPNIAFEGAYDLAGVPVSVSSTTPVTLFTFNLPAVSAGDYTRRILQVCYNADVTKATAGTGAIQVAQDGVLWQTSPRYASSAAGRFTLSGCFSFSRITQNATTITVQAVSSDTNAFTITNAQAVMTATSFNP